MNSFVPSRGSTNQNKLEFFGLLSFSSEITGIFGVSFFSLSQIILFAAMSASVIGYLSALIFFLNGFLYTLSIAFPANIVIFFSSKVNFLSNFIYKILN